LLMWVSAGCLGLVLSSGLRASSTAYAMPLSVVAESSRLVVDDAEIERMADTVGVEAGAEREEEEE